tara:strand:- start:350 stop:679 length:330 start_codon:yes stop_codon:yes gene_type:complete
MSEQNIPLPSDPELKQALMKISSLAGPLQRMIEQMEKPKVGDRLKEFTQAVESIAGQLEVFTEKTEKEMDTYEVVREICELVLHQQAELKKLNANVEAILAALGQPLAK